MSDYPIQGTPEYLAISEFYGKRKAERSGVYLMQHIHDGVNVLIAIEASIEAMRAFCIHPLLQADDDLKTVGLPYVSRARDAYVVMLAMEYRHRANAFLREKVERVRHNYDDEPELRFNGKPTYGPLIEVRDMLIADKVQNFTDFLIYHYGKHEHSEELYAYFNCWLDVLGVKPDRFIELRETMLKWRKHESM